MSKRTDRDFLIDMDQAIRRISEYTAGMSLDSFMQDTKTQDHYDAQVATLSLPPEPISPRFL